MNDAPYAISPLASASGLPCSTVRMAPRSSCAAIINSNHLRMTAARSLAVFARQPGSAASATSIARLASAAPMSGTLAISAPVAGLVTAKCLPLSASHH